MDQFWQDTLDHLVANWLVDRIVVAPDAFRHLLPTVKTYGEVDDVDTASLAAIVLHKGFFEGMVGPSSGPP